VPKEGRTRRVTQQQVRSYLGKAEEFLVAARESLTAGHRLAATSLAVHAAISAVDADPPSTRSWSPSRSRTERS
jgi:hypothetical protein